MKLIDSILKNLKVLYVEDDDFAREEIADFLEFEIGELETAENGEKGLEKFKTFKPHIVITDINMPKMNGLDMSKAIKKISPNTPIIVTSAYSDSDFIIKAIEIGISRYVLKPIDVDELLTMVIQGSKELFFEETITAQDEYIKFLIDANPAFMLVLTNQEMEHINSRFLEFLGYEDENEFLKEHKTLDNLKIGDIKELISEIMEQKKGKYVVIKKGDIKETFLVQYREFENMSKNVFIFSQITKTDEYKILLEEIKGYCPDNIQNKIERLLK
jgi:YesN/AraC family two-component response regulator